MGGELRQVIGIKRKTDSLSLKPWGNFATIRHPLETALGGSEDLVHLASPLWEAIGCLFSS